MTGPTKAGLVDTRAIGDHAMDEAEELDQNADELEARAHADRARAAMLRAIHGVYTRHQPPAPPVALVRDGAA